KESIALIAPLGLSGFFFCDLGVDAPLDQFLPILGLLSGLLKRQFAVGAQGAPRRGAVAGVAGHENKGPPSRFGNANTKAVNLSIPGIVMTKFVLKARIPLEAFDLSISEIPPHHHAPSSWQRLRNRTGVFLCCQMVAKG